MLLPWHIYQEAESDGVGIHFMTMESCACLSIPGHLAVDPAKLHTTPEETTAVAHELGHIATFSFYNVNSPFDERQRCENRADRAAILRHIDKEELLALLHNGVTEPWELAEHFGFTEEFMKKAVQLYTKGNLSTE